MSLLLFISVFVYFFFSSRRRHTRCALVTGVQTCALPITVALRVDLEAPTPVVLITPAPAGSNDWQLRRPYVRLAGVDQATGSGVRHLSYSIDGGALEVYDEPLRIERGAHELCVTATDVAGNTSRPQCRIVKTGRE